MNTDHLTHEFQQELQSDPVKRYAIQVLANNLDEQQWKLLPADLVPDIVNAIMQYGAVSFYHYCGDCKAEACQNCTSISIASDKLFQTNFDQK